MTRHISRREFVRQSALAGVALAVSSLAGCSLRPSRRHAAEIDPAAMRKFAAGLQGRVILPGDSGYESARHVWNWAIDKHPGMIVRCANAADVVRCVDFGRDHDLLVAVRAGGHSLAGKSTCDGGMVIDVSELKSIQIDPDKRIARADAGVLLGEFDHATQAFGLATTLGTAPPTGIAGLTTGGGLGWLMGKYGLACDNVREVQVVTADGHTLTANAEQNADLFWGVRGGGGNFGIVTSFEYQLHPVGPVLAGPVTYLASRLGDVLRFYREFTGALPDEIRVDIEYVSLSEDKPAPCIALCYCGDLDAGERLLKPLRSYGPRLADAVRPMPYVQIQALFDVPPVHVSAYIRSSFLRELSDGAIDVIVENAARAPSPSCTFFIERFSGAACRVGATETAFSHREPGFNFAVNASWQDPAEASRTTEWGRGFWDAMQPFLRSAVYSNYLGEEGEDRARAAYGPNYARLVALKNTYDPTNFFRLNQNIKPTA
ncbi:MAG: FAD-binding oxidoreductase [Candidatus Binatia bacterium]